ncbi:MAG: pyruvate dehydrogenase (acetyl-transferring) E1 component subunit alpha [Anaerolineales bacterium]|jgi:pyruvate dehydrogenase E1 component alpha subunit
MVDIQEAVHPLTAEKELEMLRTMLRIRAFETRADELFMRAAVRGTTHLYIGEEAIATGACAAIEPQDYITSTHRGHGHCIAKGADIRLMMAELFGKETGYCRGKGGSMHIADVETGNLGANGVVGGGIAIATGAALACTLRKNGGVVLCFFGDGASNQGVFHEALNMASIWKLPVIYICENNQYAISTPVKRSINIENVSERGAAYGIPGTTVDGNDLLAVYEEVSKAVRRARIGGGPSLIECKTYRWRGHSQRDNQSYRTKEEIEAWKEKDPIKRYKEVLITKDALSEDEYQTLIQQIEDEAEEAIRFAQESPYPKEEELYTGVYA